jgi:hypothetical protein
MRRSLPPPSRSEASLGLRAAARADCSGVDCLRDKSTTNHFLAEFPPHTPKVGSRLERYALCALLRFGTIRYMSGCARRLLLRKQRPSHPAISLCVHRGSIEARQHASMSQIIVGACLCRHTCAAVVSPMASQLRRQCHAFRALLTSEVANHSM